MTVPWRLRVGAVWTVGVVLAMVVRVVFGQGFDTPVINIRQGGLRGVSEWVR